MELRSFSFPNEGKTVVRLQRYKRFSINKNLIFPANFFFEALIISGCTVEMTATPNEKVAK
jgi:hypothetical protein